MNRLAFACLSLALAGCAVRSRSLQPSPEVRAEIDHALEQVYVAFTEAYRKADPALVAQLYEDEALYLQPGREILHGRSEIRAAFEAFLGRFPPGGPGPEIAFEIVDREIRGDLAVDVGYFRLGPEPAPDGKFIVIWKKGVDGRWRFHADGYSGVRP
jgi:uncharacterized protein (TIGR02246 family)